MWRKVGAIAGSFLFFFIAPGVVAGWIPYLLSRWRVGAPMIGIPGERIAGAVIAALGSIVLIESFARFAIKGRGTPAPIAPTESLVVSGFYRYVRNPMYVAVVAVIAGQALLFGDVALLEYAAVVWLFFHLFVLVYEEPTLRGRFGSSYDAYRANVRRWWPRLTPWQAA